MTGQSEEEPLEKFPEFYQNAFFTLTLKRISP
jgi:hypothetical protein